MIYYGNLCTQLYDLDKPHPPQDEFQFYKHYADNADSILEPMCGSGRFLVPLSQLGYNITGFDMSNDMLNACKHKLQYRGLPTTVSNATINSFKTQDSFDLIFMGGSSFSLITEDEDVIRSLKKLKSLLTDDGILLLDVLTTKCKCESKYEWVESNKQLRSDGKTIYEYSKWQYIKDTQVLSMNLKYTLEDSIDTPELMDISMRLYHPSELLPILKDIFSEVRVMKAYDLHSKPSSDDSSIIFECRK